MTEVNEISIKEKYELLVSARKFHYENYSKWMTYFYVAMSGLFIAYANWSDNIEISLPIELLGFLVGLYLFWSAKGYYYWNTHFIGMIHYYEIKVFKWKPDQRVYAVFYDKGKNNNFSSPYLGANLSTSKISILFAYTVTNFWGYLIFMNTVDKLEVIRKYPFCGYILPLLFSIVLIYLLSIFLAKSFLFSLDENFEDINTISPASENIENANY